jgi:hypothetical protein
LTFTNEIVDHIKRHRAMLQPLLRELMRLNFGCVLALDGRETDMAPFALGTDFDAIYELAASHAIPAPGSLQVRLNGKTLTAAVYDQRGHSDIELVFLRASAREFFKGMPKLISQLRLMALENFSEQNIFDMIDFGADFLMRTRHRFSYSLAAFDRTLMKAELHGKSFKVNIVDPAAYMRLGLFFLKGADAMALSFRNPFDILALLDTMQSSLRYFANTYEERGMTLEVTALGQKLLTAGYGIKSNLMTDRFGPTSLHLDAIFKILSAAFGGDRETETN